MTDTATLQMVHYDPADGTIKQVAFGFAFFELPPWTLGELDGVEAVEVKVETQQVDLTTIVQRPDLPPLVQIIDKPAIH